MRQLALHQVWCLFFACIATLTTLTPTWGKKDELATAEQLNTKVMLLYDSGKYTEAISLAKRALVINESALGQNHPTTAASLNNLATLYHLTGAYAKAEPLYERALAIREKVLGPQHPTTATSLNNLAGLYKATGTYAKAEPLYERALAIREKVLGPQHPTTATSLDDLAGLYEATGTYAKAEPLYERALAIREKVLGPQHPDTATSLNNLALLYHLTGAYAKAEPLYERALAIREKVLGPQHPATATSLNNLAGLYETTGTYAKAEPLYERALAIQLKVLGPTHPATATSLNNLAGLYKATGTYAKAEPLYERALAIREKVLGPQHPTTAASLNNLAELYETTGTYAKAEPLYERALAIWEKVLGPQHPTTATSLNNLAGLYKATGTYAKAEPLYERALAIREKVLGPQHPATATSLNNLAGLYEATGTYAKAEPLYERALAIWEKVLGPQHPDTATSLDNLATLYHVTGAYAKAEPLYERALAIQEKVLGPTHPATATSLSHLAALYEATGTYAKAEPLYERALAIREKVLGPQHPATATSLNNLAGLYKATGTYAKAEPLYERALAIQEKVLGPTHPAMATSLSHLAGLYKATGTYAKAEPLYERALAIREKVLGPQHPDTGIVLYELAFLAWRQSRSADALDKFQRAVHIEDLNARRVLVQGDEERKQAYLATLVESTVVTSFAVAAALHEPTATSLGLEVVLQRKGRILDVLTDSLLRLRKRLTPEDQELLTNYQAATTDWATLNMRGPGPLRLEQYRTQLVALQQQISSFETQLSSRSGRFRAELDPVTLEKVQRALPPRAVLLEWVHYEPFKPEAINNEPSWGAPRYAVYLLKPSGSAVLVDLGEAQAIDTEVASLLAAVRHPGGTKTVQMRAQALHRRLLQTLYPHVGSATQLLISPDGALNLLPFGVLQDSQGQYLAEQYEITYLTSGRDLLRPASSATTQHPMLLVANPDFGPLDSLATGEIVKARRSADVERGGLRFTPLPGTAQEAEVLGALLQLQPSQMMTESFATEAAVKQVHGPQILHLATHGFFLSDQPMDLTASARAAGFAPELRPLSLRQENPLLRSGLALAGANQLRSGPKDDGILTALEMASLDLDGTELAVLSACETGVGDVHNGEGVYGLRRALVLAGVRAQVVSLWKVDDATTKEFMVAYYKQLQTGMGPSAALSVVQIAMQKNPTLAHPYYWAAFVVIGNASPLN
ncbi:Kinesin light chain-like protein [Nitrospira japonica]|uniref:Kinesin light chain-like protein n=1 Tax=Nitrospira japonica TaxID=1325564 RepID=A0A1W1I3K3_9BACT|nr:tetratricopeptide repeat protein [Nitrospira japonica]SLM47423.1 Kinesin light chain-like protein [Nitrospira japonica]